MSNKIQVSLKVAISLIIFNLSGLLAQNYCPPSFISGLPLDQSIALSWAEPDSLGGYGEEVYSYCFATCGYEGLTIEHMGQDTSGGWFRDNDGIAVDCDTEMYPCSDGANESWVSEQFGAVALWSDTTAPADSRMSTALIDLTSYSGAVLSFDEYIEYSEYAHDSNFVEISTDGINWTPIHYSDPLMLGDGYFSNNIDISTYAGQSIHIGFRNFDPIGFGSNWYIDNIRVFGNDGSSYVNPCGDLTGYMVYKDGSIIATVETNEYTATGLTNGVEYCFEVKATYASGSSANALESCYAPIDPFLLSESSFRDTLDHELGEYSKFDFTLINLDTTAHAFSFTSGGLVNETAENTLLSSTFDTQESSTSFSDNQGYWSWGTPETADGTYLEYPSNTGGFYFFNDAEYYYTGTNYGYVPIDIILQSQTVVYDGIGPVFFIADIFFVNPFGDCSTGDQYAEDASIEVSSDNGATWTVVDSTIKTALEWDGYYAVNPDDANWHTMAFDLTPYISAGIFNVGIRYTDCGGNFAYGIGVDNLRIVKGDNSSWLTMEKMAGDIAAGDTMQMSLTMMPREDQNHIITSQLSIGQSASFDIDIAMITDPTALGVAAISLPNEFSLHQNYPNPFNPFTTIKYDLPERSDVSITVYDISGKEVTQLERRIHEAGQKSIRWDGTNQNGELVSAGMYIYRILAGNFHSVKKMILLK